MTDDRPVLKYTQLASSSELEDFCLIYYDEDMKIKKEIIWSNSMSELAEEAYDVVVIKGEQHTAKIYDRDLKVRYLFRKP